MYMFFIAPSHSPSLLSFFILFRMLPYKFMVSLTTHSKTTPKSLPAKLSPFWIPDLCIIIPTINTIKMFPRHLVLNWVVFSWDDITK